MKKFLAFLRWHWDSWTFGQRVYLLGAFFVGAGLKDSLVNGEPSLSVQIGFGIWSTVFLKWFFWDMFADSWKRFEKERKDLFKTIDEGK